MVAAELPKTIDVAIVGAGPQALTLVTHLLKKKPSMGDRFVVLDPSGQWLRQWQHQFAAYEIPHLRSPAVHHPDPNPHALRTFAESRFDELFPPYDLPGTQLFQDFCQELIRRWQLQNRVIPAQVEHLEPIRQRGQRFRLTMADGRILIARRVVLAISGGVPHLPAWAKALPTHYPGERLCHSHQVDLRRLRLQGEQILIVGSGLTAGHLAVGAIARGAQVLMMARRTFYEKLFDAAPGWLGPKYLKGFHAQTCWQTRWKMIRDARNGGSLTPAVLTKLRRLERSGKLSFYEQCEVHSATWQDNTWQVSCNHPEAHHCITHLPIDRIWLATGSTLNINHWPLLSAVREQYPLTDVEGLPILDQHLRWPGCNLFIMGGAAALRVGPVARNLFGGKLACDRIVPALIKSDRLGVIS
ncbi:SidA/IucD/PvdA family monooxygenase [Leptothoe kymatousa]|uniref:SidA/IucD/PvdA family monooxygenase n=1 Tax=Leptothoe kymatousa TAU-MAC 1615 TaxID=2364775 RepID=A0ABS5Y5R6_9CYAN|nr:FAD/NAD(P)-binding protein [Leptothoe kymatousa]MBT9313194.1 SidA/IucD/PvdA family monooxygenase [Leptothoe kymatousa TAU-MAC 1615]